jgi:3-dehydroquinate synthetase
VAAPGAEGAAAAQAAVAPGLGPAVLSARQAGLRLADRVRVEVLLGLFGLPWRLPVVPVERLLETMRRDKKRSARPGY